MLAVAAGIGVLVRAERIPAVQPTPTQPYEDLGIFGPASLNEMTDFDERPEFGLGIWDKRSEYGYGSGALGLWASRMRDTGPQRCAFRIQASSSWC